MSADYFVLFSSPSDKFRKRQHNISLFFRVMALSSTCDPMARPYRFLLYPALCKVRDGIRGSWPQVQVSWGFSVPLRKMVALLWQFRSGLRSLWPFQGLFPFPKIPLASWAGSCFALRAEKVALSVTALGRICRFCHGFLQNCFVYPCWHWVWRWLKANCPALELCSFPLKSTQEKC